MSDGSVNMAGFGGAQRVRDPVHDLIEFGNNELEQTLWRVIQTRPFQRLRRVRQLGFSEFVFPGATHTRFAHSIGVFHTARLLIGIIERYHKFPGADREHAAKVALAAALLHDVGHGAFSHTFEKIGKQLTLPMACHEDVSVALIKEGDIASVLKEKMGSGFADDVANVIRGKPSNMYHAVVSSQFDADRLDYMQRDRMMTGVRSSAIDLTWLINNLEVESVCPGADEESLGTSKIETFVLGAKAFHAAESYVLSLFQLYPNVYLHKTTRGAEKLFHALMLRIFECVKNGDKNMTGLPSTHPILRFAKKSSLEHALMLDDMVFWGALPMMVEAKDRFISSCALGLWERRLPKCFDIRQYVESAFPVRPNMTAEQRAEREAQIRVACKSAVSDLEEKFGVGVGQQIFLDQDQRSPYKRFQDSKTVLNQIMIRQPGGTVADMAHLSSVVASANSFEVCRAYYTADDTAARDRIQNIVRTSLGKGKDGAL